MNCNKAELMAIVFSRAIRDGDVIVLGTNPAIPISAYRIAQLCGRPRAVALIGGTGAIDPTVALAPESGGDQSFVPGRLTIGLTATLCDQVRGFADVIFLGGLQIDRLGRINLAVIGDYDRPRLRGPGSIGLSLVTVVKRTFMFFQSHDRRTFVDQVDFVSGEGLSQGGGVELIVTPLGVLGPSLDGKRIDLKSLHHGVSFEQIQQHTGFPLDPNGATPTAPPSEQELAALRSFPEGRLLAALRLEDA